MKHFIFTILYMNEKGAGRTEKVYMGEIVERCTIGQNINQN